MKWLIWLKLSYILFQTLACIYFYAMSKFPATGGFKWINPTKFDLNKLVSNNPESCALEVDLEYPKGLHDLHDDLHEN